jgi:Ran GTPase-activating protein (RanGAP) involved in mRNA processing and transport
MSKRRAAKPSPQVTTTPSAPNAIPKSSAPTAASSSTTTEAQIAAAEAAAPAARAAGDPRFAELLQGKAGCEISDAALRGITLGQLEHLFACATKLCVEEQWRSTAPRAEGVADAAVLRPDEITLYDLVHHLVMPATDGGVRSLTEALADGPQRPDWFVSHFWGESVSKFVKCLRRHAQDRGLSSDTCYWVCAYANRQDPAQVAAELGGSLETSPFYRALFLCTGMVTVLDKHAAAFGRAWCSYETYLALIERDTAFLHDIYTAEADETMYGRTDEDEAVGLADGFCYADEHDDYIPAIAKAQREAAFPQKLADAVLGKSVRTAQASMASDLAKIRERIAGVEDEVDATVTSRFAIASFDRILASDADDSEVELRARFLAALKTSRLRKLAYSNVEGMPLGKEATAEMGAALPSGLELLSLHVGHGDVLMPAIGALLQAPASRLRALTLSTCQMSVAGLVALATALTGNKTLEKLDVGSNAMGDEGAAALGRALDGNTALTELDLGSSEIGDAGAAELAKGLRSCTALRALALSSNAIADEGGAALGESLRSLPALERLALGRNRIGDIGGAAIGRGLAASGALLVIDLSNNTLGGEAAIELGRVLQASTTIKTLNLSYNQLGDAGAAGLGKGLAVNRSLETLDLAKTDIGGAGAAELSKGVQANPTLTDLSLALNHKIGDGVAAFGPALTASQSLRKLSLMAVSMGDVGLAGLGQGLASNTALTSLDLGSNEFTGDDATAFFDGLRANRALTTLTLRYGKVGDAGGAAFGRALEGNATLKTLTLASNTIGDAGALGLGQALAANAVLNSLDLSSNQIGDEGAAALGKGYELNTTLTRLQLTRNKLTAAGKASLVSSGAINLAQPRTAAALVIRI